VDRHVRAALSGQPRKVVHAIRLAHDVLSIYGAVVVAVLTGIVLWALDRRPRAFVLLAAAVAGGAVLPPVVRALVARPNPLFEAERLVDRTFPATTSTVAAATAVGLLVVLLPRIGRWTRMVTWTFAVIGVVIAAGFAELFTTDVYLSDVLGGAVLGALWGLAVSTAVTSVWRPAATGTDMRTT
jgi:membrane-associated phospholipid phosphatase